MLSDLTTSNLVDMSHVDLEQHLDQIVGEAGKGRESVDIRICLDRYPDLVGYRHHTNEVLLSSGEINPFCTGVLIQRYGKEFVALPYIEDMSVRLHSNPVVYYLGLDNDNGFGIIPYSNWEEHFVNNEISKEIINKVKDFLDQHKPSYYL